MNQLELLETDGGGVGDFAVAIGCGALGFVVGGVVGNFVAGPVGAVYGADIGKKVGDVVGGFICASFVTAGASMLVKELVQSDN